MRNVKPSFKYYAKYHHDNLWYPVQILSNLCYNDSGEAYVTVKYVGYNEVHNVHIKNVWPNPGSNEFMVQKKIIESVEIPRQTEIKTPKYKTAAELFTSYVKFASLISKYRTAKPVVTDCYDDLLANTSKKDQPIATVSRSQSQILKSIAEKRESFEKCVKSELKQIQSTQLNVSGKLSNTKECTSSIVHHMENVESGKQKSDKQISIGAQRKESSKLILSAKSGNMKKFKMCIKKGANVNFQEKRHGYTALHWAAWKGNVAMCKLLLRKKANPLVCNKRGETCVISAEIAGKNQIVQILKDKIDESSNNRLQDNMVSLENSLSSKETQKQIRNCEGENGEANHQDNTANTANKSIFADKETCEDANHTKSPKIKADNKGFLEAQIDLERKASFQGKVETASRTSTQEVILSSENIVFRDAYDEDATCKILLGLHEKKKSTNSN